jgi:hypothetical protein
MTCCAETMPSTTCWPPVTNDPSTSPGPVYQRIDDVSEIQRQHRIHETLAGDDKRPCDLVEAESDSSDNVKECLRNGHLQRLLHCEDPLAPLDDRVQGWLANGDNASHQRGFDGGERTEEVAGEHLLRDCSQCFWDEGDRLAQTRCRSTQSDSEGDQIIDLVEDVLPERRKREDVCNRRRQLHSGQVDFGDVRLWCQRRRRRRGGRHRDNGAADQHDTSGNPWTYGCIHDDPRSPRLGEKLPNRNVN